MTWVSCSDQEETFRLQPGTFLATTSNGHAAFRVLLTTFCSEGGESTVKIEPAQDKACKEIIVCLHGGPGLDASYFFPYLNPLLKYVSLVHFRQGKPGSASLDDVVSEVEDVMKRLPEGAIVYLLGHSWGGALALEYVRRHPKSVTGLILTSWVYDSEWHQYRDRKSAPKPIPDYTSLPTADERFSFVTKAVSDLYFNEDVLKEGEKILHRIDYNGDLWERFGQSFVYDKLNSRDVLASLTIPTISISGTNDLCVPVEYVRKGLSLNHLIHSVEIPGADHFPFVQYSNEFNSSVISFIKQRNIS
jgi:proline iminopeptidase